jgi:hypothetical protein
LRRAIFTWFNTHLKGDPTPVRDDVTDYVEPAENLLVFGGQLPEDDRMRDIDKLLVPSGELPEVTDEEAWRAYQQAVLSRLRELTFRHIPPDARPPRVRESRSDGGTRDGTAYATQVFDTCDGLTLNLTTARPNSGHWPIPTVAFALRADARSAFRGGGSSRPAIATEFATGGVAVRHTGATSVGPGYLWTLRRVYPLLGQTLPERQVHDLLLGVQLLRSDPATGALALFGREETALLAIYAAMLDPQISEVVLDDPPASHEDPSTPELLGILRIGDLPHNLALLFPRPITFIGEMPAAYEWTRAVYQKLGYGDRIRVIGSVREWRPRR